MQQPNRSGWCAVAVVALAWSYFFGVPFVSLFAEGRRGSYVSFAVEILLYLGAMFAAARALGQPRRKLAVSSVVAANLILGMVFYSTITAARQTSVARTTESRSVPFAVSDDRYIAQQRSLGYECAVQPPTSDPFTPGGVKSGYRSTLILCHSRYGKPDHYRSYTVPVNYGQSGQRSFCSDESGVIRYVNAASPEACFARGEPLQ